MKEITFLTDDELKSIIDGCVDGVYPTAQETAMANELITARTKIKELESENQQTFTEDEIELDNVIFETNFIDEKTKRFYLIFVDLFMNLSMNGFTIDLYENEEMLQSNFQLSDFFNIHFHNKPRSVYRLLLQHGGIDAGIIDIELDYQRLLHETFMIHMYSKNISKIVAATQNFIKYLNNFDVEDLKNNKTN